MKISLKRNFNSIVNFSYKNFSNLSTVQIVAQRDAEIARKVLTSDSYSSADFSNFLRVVNKNKGNQELLARFSSELPKHINYLDDLDTRKAISVLLANPSLHQNENLIALLRERFTEVRKIKQMSSDNVVRIGADFSNFPLSILFWIRFARLREKMYKFIRSRGLSLK